MSEVKYVKCDGRDCGNVTPDEPGTPAWSALARWGHLVVGGEAWDLCPDCAKKALEAVGVE